MAVHNDVDVSILESQTSSRTTSPEPVSRARQFLPSPRRHLITSFQLAVAKTEALVQEWTPFLLVSSYFVFSITMYMICSQKLIQIFWFIYLLTNFYIAFNAVLESVMSIRPCRESRKAAVKVERNNWTFPTPDDKLLILDIVIVAYLPNEKDIIMDRIFYALEEIIYPKDKIRINIVYNTPVPLEPLESEMHALTVKYPQLRVIKVPGSKSKADNLNYFFTLDTGSDVIAIYDCDHYPQPNSPRWAIERFMQSNKNDIDIVQGRCVVFNTNACLLASIIGVEFDKIYAVSHPGRSATWGFGLFCGSNGYWRSSVIRKLKMDTTMLTEDIDSALRAYTSGARAVHDNNVVSYELAPTTFAAFWKQRLRWAQGWAQASMRHIVLVWSKPPEGVKRPLIERFGVLSLLLIRELSYYLVTQYLCLVISLVITGFPTSGAALVRLLFFQYPIAYWLFIISATCLIGTLVITMRVKSEFISPWMLIQFTVMYPFYLVLTAVIGLYGHARQIAKYDSWDPTPRS